MMDILQPDQCMACNDPSLRRKPGVAHVQDAQSVAWLERTLAAFKGTVVAVTHDRCVAMTYIRQESPMCSSLECYACLGLSFEPAYAAECASGIPYDVCRLRVLPVSAYLQPHRCILAVWHSRLSTTLLAGS